MQTDYWAFYDSLLGKQGMLYHWECLPLTEENI